MDNQHNSSPTDNVNEQIKQQLAEQSQLLNLVSAVLNDPGSEQHSCSEDTDSKERAKVGPYLSTQVDVDTYCSGAPHPSDSHEYKTVDTRTGKQLQLTDIFSKDDIYKALMKDDIVQAALAETHAHPENFDELQKVLNKDGGTFVDKERPGQEPIDLFLNNDMFSNFSFHHLSKDNKDVAVRLLPDYGGEASRNQMWELGIYLPIPPQLKAAFEEANDGKNGFLMKDSQARGKTTSKHRDYTDTY